VDGGRRTPVGTGHAGGSVTEVAAAERDVVRGGVRTGCAGRTRRSARCGTFGRGETPCSGTGQTRSLVTSTQTGRRGDSTGHSGRPLTWATQPLAARSPSCTHDDSKRPSAVRVGSTS